MGDIQVFGGQYAMRIWLDPFKLNAYSLQPSDVSTAIRAQNIQVSAGKIGGLPSPDNQQLTATVRAQSRLQTPEQFRHIIVKSDRNGAIVRVGDVARVVRGDRAGRAVARAVRLQVRGSNQQPVVLVLRAEAVRAVVRETRAVAEAVCAAVLEAREVGCRLVHCFVVQ